MNSLRPRGMLVVFGNASGPVPPVDPLLLSQKGSLFMTRPTLAHYIATREELEKRSSDLFTWVTAEAHRRLASRATSGKVLLAP
jgi:NADPH2:quinone reductase